ncbi:Gtr1/RagA G protein conserved region-domain-containing protein [Neohortaea acidophila]|uniref:GTP-binding protein n=1 Tax=Neohortaea acidophila TaxID=245834 RepID=A0A6A6PMP5_9PEZI|nr:Gtr1/RagA G protein conserved region-domain-containing protein [Neohortaea acidophila]KAF2480914.1 Gtr1/RagA G protein conserved region-domain-containing protein [Neohortaea acidophila]
MRTLFSDKIHAPCSPAAELRPDPFELPFQSSLHSSRSASVVNNWLTQQFQNELPSTNETSYTHGAPNPLPPMRRKANPRFVFMGMRRCGKSSVQKVVVQKLPPADSLYLEPTYKVEHATMHGSFLHFESAEIPTQLPVLSPSYDHASIFSNIGAVIWIIDSQDEYFSSISELLRTAVFLAKNYPSINLDVFIHKTDGLSEEYKYDTFREVRQRVQDELSDVGYGHRSISYYQTSIFDHSIFEAMSKVVQKLLPQLPSLETLLTKLCATCRIQKAYLFDTVSKIYIATDASPTLLKDYEVCSDYVDVIVDIKQLYGWQEQVGAPSTSPPQQQEQQEEDEQRQNSSDAGLIGESIVTYDKTGDGYMFAREVNDSLSLICIMGKGSSVEKRVLIDYNVDVFVDAVVKIFQV